MAANSPDVLEAKQEYFKRTRSRKRGQRSPVQLLIDWYYGEQCRYERMKSIVSYDAQSLHNGWDPLTGINLGRNMLYVEL